MTTTNLILIGVAVVAIFGALGAFAIAFRRTSRDTTPDWESRVERDAREADQSLRGVRVEPVAVAEPEPAVEAVEPVTAEPDAAPDAETEPEREPVGVGVAVVEAQRVVEVSPEEAGVTRRQFFNRALGATFGLWGAGLGLGFLAFFWPRVSGGFGASINAGNVSDILGELRDADGNIVPLFIPEARAYVVPAPTTLSEQFEGRNVEAGGLMALYQRCVHLGCRVPWCATSQGFECPCHGSKYNAIGEYFAGPAPRNLDRFAVEVNDSNEFIIHTGTPVETPRAPAQSVEYPRGPSCI
ncbi:MAG TPA: Rieske 2Fe-2S domain-containing protein [Acidimicrobiia bacterium]